MSITDNLSAIRKSIPETVTIVAVSKTKPNADLMEAYRAGQRVFGENKIQEMSQKWIDLPKDIQWHMIGHVQTNKVKYMAEFVALVHGVDSFKLLKEINKQAKKNTRVIKCLLQIHIAVEDTKFGLDEAELFEIIASDDFKALHNIEVVGLMGMATFTANDEQVRSEFRTLKKMFEKAKNKLTNCTILSMGMSGDYKIAIDEGSTMVRIGSSIFGSR